MPLNLPRAERSCSRPKLESQAHEESIIRFSVSDTGIGIPLEMQQSIFSPFTQADTSTTRKYGGTGLGLTISARLVSMMGGRIWLESEVGRGTRFCFTVRMQPYAGTTESAMIAAPESLRDVRILVVDDNQTNRRILQGTLRLWEAPTTCVESGAQALLELGSALQAGNALPVGRVRHAYAGDGRVRPGGRHPQSAAVRLSPRQ